MKKSIIISSGIILAIFASACRQAPVNNSTGDNETSSPQGISINMTQTQMVGKQAPEFQLNDISGKSVLLSDFHGKPVFLTFWASWSPDCRREMPVIQQIYDKWQSQGLVVLTIDILNSRPEETQANLESFMSTNNYSFPVLLDTNQLATIQYHVGDTPTNVLIDKDGFIREIIPGPFLSESAVETSLTRIIQ
ncbi:MAG: TlpA disulfide reductase family protein [Dehalococcoidales bacterium]|nr:TlpA disulfide reductase family protein [Dehalococcoidales bacterium]